MDAGRKLEILRQLAHADGRLAEVVLRKLGDAVATDLEELRELELVEIRPLPSLGKEYVALTPLGRQWLDDVELRMSLGRPQPVGDQSPGMLGRDETATVADRHAHAVVRFVDCAAGLSPQSQ